MTKGKTTPAHHQSRRQLRPLPHVKRRKLQTDSVARAQRGKAKHLSGEKSRLYCFVLYRRKISREGEEKKKEDQSENNGGTESARVYVDKSHRKAPGGAGTMTATGGPRGSSYTIEETIAGVQRGGKPG